LEIIENFFLATSGTKQTGRDERKILTPGKKVAQILIICNKLTRLFVAQLKLTCWSRL